MSMTDPIADMLTRIRNACGAKHRRVDMPGSKMKVEIAKILKENHFIQDYKTLEAETGRQTLRVVLKYAHGDTQHIEGADVRPSGAPGAHRRRDSRPRLVRE